MEMQKPVAQEGGWLVVWLLFFFMLINFADKAIIGLAAVPMMKEIGLTPKEFGLVNSSFFFLFSISAVVTGFIVNRIQARWAILVMAIVWALAQVPMLGSVGLPTLIVSRMALGAGEGPAYPVALHATYKFFPHELRTLPTAVILQGASVGVVLAIPIMGYLIEEYSWRSAFGFLGLIGFIWTVAWLVLGKEGAIADATTGSVGPIERVPYAKLLLNGTTLSAFATGFGAYWGLSLLVGWFTPFLIQGLGFTQKEAGWITTLPWAAWPVVGIASGWISQRMLARGIGSRWARGVFGGASVAIGGLALIAMPFVPGAALKITMMVIGIALPAVIYIMGHAMMSEFTPVSQRGAVLSVNNAVATSAGLIGPYIMGSVVQDAMRAGSSVADGYMHGFMICGVVALGCGVLGILFLRPQHQAVQIAQYKQEGIILAAA
jgi:MFS family permease